MAIDRHIARVFLKIHILSRAAWAEVYGLGVIERFGALGFEVSPGTVYPTLNAMANEGDLTVRATVVGGKRRRLYRITRKGREELLDARRILKTLSRDLDAGARPQGRC